MKNIKLIEAIGMLFEVKIGSTEDDMYNEQRTVYVVANGIDLVIPIVRQMFNNDDTTLIMGIKDLSSIIAIDENVLPNSKYKIDATTYNYQQLRELQAIATLSQAQRDNIHEIMQAIDDCDDSYYGKFESDLEYTDGKNMADQSAMEIDQESERT